MLDISEMALIIIICVTDGYIWSLPFSNWENFTDIPLRFVQASLKQGIPDLRFFSLKAGPSREEGFSRRGFPN
jgi:hypothetical protein